MNIDTNHFKTKLEAEKKTLENELKTIGVKDAGGWEAELKNVNDEEPSDRTETADALEETELNTSIIANLQPQLDAVNTALEKIKEGTYGTCEVCGKEIEVERLEANPSATTCIAHL
jgi:RNA polymerase-binding protein DksA